MHDKILLRCHQILIVNLIITELLFRISICYQDSIQLLNNRILCEN